MVFSSVTFLFYFLPIFIACYVLTPTVVGKNIVTLLFSLVFYAWGEPRFLLILVFAIAFNYVAAIVIDRNEGEATAMGARPSPSPAIFSCSESSNTPISPPPISPRS